MKVNVNKEIILKELGNAAKFRAKEGINFTFLSTVEKGLSIKSTDGTVYNSDIIPLEVVGEEDLIVAHSIIEPGTALITPIVEDVIRKVPSEQLTLTVSSGKITITAEGFDATVSLSEGDFPNAPQGEVISEISSPFSFFDDLLKYSGVASAVSDSRPVLQGINLKGNGEDFRSVTTDSYRLSSYKVPSSINFNNVTVPTKAFATVLDTMDKDEKIRFMHIGNYVKLVQGDHEVYIKLLDGNYPDVEKICSLPATHKQVRVKTREILTAIDRAMLFAKNDSKKTSKIIRASFENNSMKIFSQNEQGSIDTSIQCISVSEGIPTEVYAYQGGFLTDAIKAHHSDEVILNIGTNAQALFITSDKEGVIQLVLPIKI
jgi:DNA polymerase III subunit beta